MKKIEFRNLEASEIECRVGTSSVGKGVSLLLYKDARCDMSLLDEKFGPMGWKRDHQLINGNLFCTVSIKDENGEWITKQDVGVESNTEKEKGQASDAFKRACVNWGIGRELYTAPFIWINLANTEWKIDRRGNKVPAVNFKVSKIEYSGKTITGLEVVEEKTNVVRFTFKAGKTISKKAPEKKMSEEEEQSLETALADIKVARNRKELTVIWNELTAFHTEQRFIQALSDRQKELNELGIKD